MARLARWLYPGFGMTSAQTPAVMASRETKRGGETPGAGAAVITRTRTQTKRPNMYRVLLLNDDYTPMEFVVHVLERFFNKDGESARRIMMQVHQHGIGECEIYTYEVAETKVTKTTHLAKAQQFPLQLSIEPTD